ncbi:DMT family transporter [Gudongella oleilytica]|uniref:DMT family transporter n=1 Tax=Gudongella oleilytica TaxID=1582259 RepID=UPI000FF89D23|nr:DMT family transporter [Gudongella oleilytica]
MPQGNIGELAAVATAISWTLVGLFFSQASKRIGSLSVNFYKLIFGFTMLSITAYFTRGIALPVDATLKNWTWLALSGIVGFFLGDYFMLKAYIEVGVRVSMLMMASSPPMAALLGFFFLSERLSPSALLGMLITISGIVLVILSKDNGRMRVRYSIKGLTYAFIGAFGSASGMVFSKIGLGDYNTMAATQIRIIAGFLCFVIFVTVRNEWKNLRSAIMDRKALKYTFLGSIFGPFIGVNLSLVALKYTSTGIVSTITSMTPVTIIPFSIALFKEKVKPREILGALISVSGVAILLLT